VGRLESCSWSVCGSGLLCQRAGEAWDGEAAVQALHLAPQGTVVMILDEEEEEIVVFTSAGHSEEEFVGLRHCGELSCIAGVFVRLRHFSLKKCYQA